jgi:hypothetical protein
MIRNSLITILTVLISCSHAIDVGKWKIIKTKGIQEENISFDFMSFLNKDSALLLGSSYTDDNLINKRFEEFDAVVYHSNDGG